MKRYYTVHPTISKPASGYDVYLEDEDGYGDFIKHFDTFKQAEKCAIDLNRKHVIKTNRKTETRKDSAQ